MTELAFDATLLRETQCRALNSYIENGRGFEEGARDIENRFKDFEESFRGLVLNFNEWAKESESKLKKRCQDVDKMEVGHHVTLIWATATVVLYAAAAIYYPQACFYILNTYMFKVGMVGGMGTLGADEARRASEAIISIQTTREILFRTGTEKHQKLKQDMCFLSKVWQTAHNDATELVRCLEGGTSMIDMPKYLQRSAEGATSFYKKMANYLRVYADGIQAVHLPTLSSPQSDKQ
ncbi:hypothetical protein FRC17_003020 [Serendipita sp. 399]|nr:hypothetical protein FRC17_003020 [Serendipita sp. 399]